MKTYQIEHKIHTLLHNAAGCGKEIDRFETAGILFKQHDFSMTKGWKTNFWLASGEVKAPSGFDATNMFRNKLDTVVSALCLVGQAFTEYRTCSSLTTKVSSNEALFVYYEEDSEGNNLMLMPEHILGIQELLDDRRDFSVFLKYWKDITNTPDFVAKLILYCASLDALTKCLSNGNWKYEKHRLRTEILGETLKVKLFGTQDNSACGIRHRLVHGEYFESLDDIGLDEIHKSIVDYFNKEIFKRKIVSEKVVNPQRNPYKNFKILARAIRFKNAQQKGLIELEKDFSQCAGDTSKLDLFEFLGPEENNRIVKEF